MIEFIAYGTPGPQGSKKFVGLSKSGKGLMIESSRKVKPWRENVVLAAQKAIRGRQMFTCPVIVRMVFTVERPKIAKNRHFPSVKPDVSKLVRSTEDALTSAGVWKDDALAVEYSRVAKFYPNTDPESLDYPGVRIRIDEISRSSGESWRNSFLNVGYESHAEYPGLENRLDSTLLHCKAEPI